MEEEMEAIRAGMKEIRKKRIVYNPIRWDYGKGATVPCDHVAKQLGYENCERMYKHLVKHEGAPPGGAVIQDVLKEYGAGGHFVEEGYKFNKETAGTIAAVPIVLVAIAIGVLGYLLFGRQQE